MTLMRKINPHFSIITIQEKEKDMQNKIEINSHSKKIFLYNQKIL